MRTGGGSGAAVVLTMLAVPWALLLGPATGAAQEGAWTQVGPDGGSVISLAVDPSDPATAYAVTRSGLYKTVDAGALWSHRDVGTIFLLPTKVVIDPTTPSTIYAAGEGGVAKSTDGGTTWQALTDEGTSTSVGLLNAVDLVIDPQVTGTLYVASLFGVFKSVDGGSTWEPSGSGLRPKAELTSLTIDPSQPTTLYAATAVGVFKSSDAGASWQPSRTGMGTARVVAMAIDAAAPGRLYAAIGAYAPGAVRAHGLYVSADGGGTWAPLSVAADNPFVLCLAVPPGTAGTVYACTTDGLYRSEDGGAAWARIDRPGMPQVGSLAIAPSLPTRVYAGAWQPSSSGPPVYRTSSAGASWAAAGHGLSAPSEGFVVDPLHAGTAYQATAGGLWKTLDYGNSWMLAGSGFEASGEFELAICAAAPANLFTVSLDKVSRLRAIFATQSAAARWRPLATPFDLVGPLPLTADPRDSKVLYSAGETRSGLQLWKTADGGASWEPLHLGPFGLWLPSLAVAPSSPSTLYVRKSGVMGTTYDSSLLASHDGGASFEVVNTFHFLVGGLVVDPKEPDTVYLLASALLKSTDGGRTFSALSVPGGSTTALAIDPAQPALLYAGTFGEVEVSHDGGQTWTERLGGLPSFSFDGLTVAPGGDLYALVDEALYRIHP